MKCPSCDAADNGVLYSRPKPDRIVRRRKCLSCGFRWTTLEITQASLEQRVEATKQARRHALRYQAQTQGARSDA